MKKLKYISLIFTLSLLIIGISACSDDSPKIDDDNNSENIPDTNPTEKELTPEESKEYIESVTKEFLNSFDANDQKELIELTNYFSDRYADFDMPEEWCDLDDDFDSPFYSPRRVMSNLKKGIKNPSTLTRVMANVYDFERYAGIYEPNMSRYEWEKTSNSKDIIFRFPNRQGNVCEIRAVNNGSAVWNEELDNGNTVKFPGNVTLIVTLGGKKLVEGIVNVNPDREKHTFTANYDITAANLHVVGSARGNDSKITQETTVSVSGKTLIESSAEINGRDLCDENVWREDRFDEKFLNNGHAEVNILGKIQLKGDCSDFTEIADALDSSYYSGDAEGYSRNEAEKLCKQDCNLLNKKIKINIFYNTDISQAKITYRPVIESYNGEYYSYWDIWAEPMLQFADGTTYSFEDYFGNNRFMSVENQWESLLDSYEAIWDVY